MKPIQRVYAAMILAGCLIYSGTIIGAVVLIPGWLVYRIASK